MRKTALFKYFCGCFDFRKGLACFAFVNLIVCSFIIWALWYVLFLKKYTNIVEIMVFYLAPVDVVWTVILLIAAYVNRPWLLKVVFGYNLVWAIMHLSLVIVVLVLAAQFLGAARLASVIFLLLLYLLVPVLWIVYRAYICVVILSLVYQLELEAYVKAGNTRRVEEL